MNKLHEAGEANLGGFFVEELPMSVAGLRAKMVDLRKKYLGSQGRAHVLVFHRDWTQPFPPDSMSRVGLILKALKDQTVSNMRTTITTSLDSLYIRELVELPEARGYVVAMLVPSTSILFRERPMRNKTISGSPITPYNSQIYGPLPEAFADRKLATDEYYVHIPPSQIIGYFIKR